MTSPILLSDEQMQYFIAHGFLRLQTTLPEAFHRRIYDRFDAMIGGDAGGGPGNNLLPACPEIGDVFDDPVVVGALTSVLGPDYVMHPHRALHNNVPGTPAQIMHKDSYWGYRARVRNHRSRWAMIMYVPQTTPLEKGPTGVIGGSQYQTRRPDPSVMPESAGCLEAGGFLLIHYDIWHRKMKNLTQNKRFMMKFEFSRMREPEAPTWNHTDPTWRLRDLPAVDMSAVWKRQWDWLRHGERAAVPVGNGPEQALTATDTEDFGALLRGINAIAADRAAARAQIDTLIGLLEHPFDPVSIDAAYALATAGEAAVAPLTAVILAHDGEHIAEKSTGSGALDYLPEERIARSAMYGLVEIGADAVPALLHLLTRGQSRARKLAAFALGEIVEVGDAAVQALCDAVRDGEPAVRVNVVEALGYMPPTPAVLAALTDGVRDPDGEVRFSAAFSLARLGPDAETTVPVLAEALGDSNRYVPGYAVEALERIGTPDATRTLVPFLKKARWCAHTTLRSAY